MSLLDENGLARVWNKMKTWVGTKVQTDVPANAVFTDTKVTQTESTTNENYEVLVSGTASTATTTEGVNKSVGFRYNSSLKAVMEGTATTAGGDSSHAEGYGTVAQGSFSHAEGYYTTASHRGQHVFGEYNIADPSENDSDKKGNYVEIVGNGLSSTQHSNARTLDWSGNEVLSGKLTVGAAPTNDMDVATKKYVDDADNALNSSLVGNTLFSGNSNSSISLSDDVSNYSIIEIFYRSNDGYHSSVKILATASQFMTNGFYLPPTSSSATTVYFKNTVWNISGSTISPYASNQISIPNGSSPTTNKSNNFIYITKVVGYVINS